jgi:hypothetical protein
MLSRAMLRHALIALLLLFATPSGAQAAPLEVTITYLTRASRR